MTAEQGWVSYFDIDVDFDVTEFAALMADVANICTDPHPLTPNIKRIAIIAHLDYEAGKAAVLDRLGSISSGNNFNKVIIIELSV